MTEIMLSSNQKKPRRKKFVEKCFKFSFPLLLLFIYAAIMAGIFYAIEKDCKSVLHCSATKIKVTRTAMQLPTVQQQPMIAADPTVAWNDSSSTSVLADTTTTTPAVAQTNIQTTYETSKTITEKAPWSQLTYFVAFHFILISITTIGYGDIYPCSVGGQILTIVSTIVGIPITLMALTRTAKTVAAGLHIIWLFVYKKVKKAPYTKKQLRYMDHEAYVPLYFGGLVLIIWILISAEYFYLTLFNDYNPDPNTPPFTYFLAFYFTMISFLTIGFGDYAPIRYDLIFISMFFFIFGLTLVTMCIDLAQLEFDMYFEEVVDLIDDRYKESLDDDSNEMSSDNRVGVKQIINSKASLSTKMMASMMGKKTENHLAEAYREKAKYISMFAQTILLVEHQEIQALVLEVKRERDDFSCQCDFPEENVENVGGREKEQIKTNQIKSNGNVIKKKNN